MNVAQIVLTVPRLSCPRGQLLPLLSGDVSQGISSFWLRSLLVEFLSFEMGESK